MNRDLLLGLLAGLALGALGAWLLLAPSRGGKDVPPAAVDRASAGDVPPDARRLVGSPGTDRALETALERAHLRIAALEAERDALRDPAGPAPAAPKEAPAVPERAREQAARLGVSDAALEAFWRARTAYWSGGAEERERILAALRPHAAEAVRAVAALQLGGGGHVALPAILAGLELPDGGDQLIAMIESEQVRPLLRALPGYDSPHVRTYLLERVARETDPAGLWYAAESLGDLGEERGAEAIDVRTLMQDGWGGVRGRILYQVGRMGGPAAARLLEEYVRMPQVDALGSALLALAKIDPEAARGHARRLRESERWPFLDVSDRSAIEKIAGRD